MMPGWLAIRRVVPRRMSAFSEGRYLGASDVAFQAGRFAQIHGHLIAVWAVALGASFTSGCSKLVWLVSFLGRQALGSVQWSCPPENSAAESVRSAMNFQQLSGAASAQVFCFAGGLYYLLQGLEFPAHVKPVTVFDIFIP